MLKGAHHDSEFKVINPASTVPALVDGDIKLFDSSAIAIYLVENYAKDDSLYPKEKLKRAKVNEKLFYVATSVFPSIFNVFFPVIFKDAIEIPETAIQRLHRVYGTIEMILADQEYLSGSELTLPDLFLWCITESINRVVPIDNEKHPKYIAWLEKMRQHPCNQYQQDGVDLHIQVFEMAKERNIKAKQQ